MHLEVTIIAFDIIFEIFYLHVLKRPNYPIFLRRALIFLLRIFSDYYYINLGLIVHRKQHEQKPTHYILADSVRSFDSVLVCCFPFPTTNSIKTGNSSGEDLIDLSSNYNKHRIEIRTRWV